MQQDNQEVLRSLDQKEKSARKGALIGYAIAAIGAVAAGVAQMYVASKHIGPGWFKEFWKSAFSFKIPKWFRPTVENPVWQVGTGVGLGGLAVGLLQEHKANTLAEVKDAMTPRGIPVENADKQWTSDDLRKDPKLEEPPVRAK